MSVGIGFCAIFGQPAFEYMTNSHQRTDYFVGDSRIRAAPCVDVLVAARDRADTIERAVLSALAQNEVRTVIVVDDGSGDDTAARASRCDPQSKRVIIQRLQSSFGPAAARNIAIEISTAPWLAVLDADDFFLPGRIGALLAHADECDLLADDLLQVSEPLRVSKNHAGYELPIPSAASIKPRRLSFEQFVLGNVTRRGFNRKELGYLKPLIRRGFLDHHGLRYDEGLRLGEDYALYARALAAGARFLLVPTTGYVAVERADSLSARHSRQDLEALRNSDGELMAMYLTPSERDALAKHHADVDRRAQWLVVVEALQSHNYPRFLSTFFRSPALSLHLLERLISEVPSQIRKHLRHLRG
jgi:succinoglycan biosynthesis protein ExoU